MFKYFKMAGEMLPKTSTPALPRFFNPFGSAAYGSQPPYFGNFPKTPPQFGNFSNPNFGQSFNQNPGGQRFFATNRNSNNGIVYGPADYDPKQSLCKLAQGPLFVKGFILPQYVPLHVVWQIKDIPFNELPEEIKRKFDQRAIDRIILEENKLKEIEDTLKLREVNKQFYQKKAQEIIQKYTKCG